MQGLFGLRLAQTKKCQTKPHDHFRVFKAEKMYSLTYSIAKKKHKNVGFTFLPYSSFATVPPLFGAHAINLNLWVLTFYRALFLGNLAKNLCILK